MWFFGNPRTANKQHGTCILSSAFLWFCSNFLHLSSTALLFSLSLLSSLM